MLILDIRIKSDSGQCNFYGVYDDPYRMSAILKLGDRTDGNVEKTTIAIMDASGDADRTQDFRRYLASANLYDNLPCSGALAELVDTMTNPSNTVTVSTGVNIEPRAGTETREASDPVALVIPDANTTLSILVDNWRSESTSIGKHNLQLFYQSLNTAYVYKQTCVDGCLLDYSIVSFHSLCPTTKTFMYL